MTYAPDAPTLPKLSAISKLVTAAIPVSQTFALRPKFLAKLPGGQLYLDSELQLDTDGWPGPPGGTEPTHQDETSLRYNDDKSINANTVPFFVLPLPISWPAQFGIALGDYAAVLYKNRLAYAVFADQGPKAKIGEGSIELFRRLGQERIKPNGHVWDTGMGPHVITIVFPGSGKGQRHFANQTSLITDLEVTGRASFTALGGDPDA
jgi:Fungal chitosanase of glycosyl hydrolase group 75